MNWKAIYKISLAIILLVMFVVLLISATIHRRQSPVFDIHVAFQDDHIHFLTVEDVKKQVNSIIDRSGVEIQHVDLQHIENQVIENEYVLHCDAYIDNRNKLMLNIIQKKPVARVIHETGVSYYIDKNALKFSLTNTFTANVPIISGKMGYDIDSLGVQQNKEMNQIIELISIAKTNSFANAILSGIDVQKNGDLVIVSRLYGHKINIGDVSILEDKFARLELFYKEGVPRVSGENYSQINVKYKNQIIAQ